MNGGGAGLPLRVAVDASALRAGRSGIGVYVEKLLAALPAAGVQPLPFSNRPVPGWPEASRWPLRPTALWTWGPAAWQAQRLGADLLHFPTGRSPRRGRRPQVVTVHDLWPLSAGSGLRRRERWLTLPGLRRGIVAADRIIAVSQDTAAALRQRFPQSASRVVVVPEAPSLDPAQALWSTSRLRRWLGLADGQPYWLHVGTLEPRKGLERAVEALSRAHRSLAAAGQATVMPPVLVLAGADGGQGRQLEALARCLGVHALLRRTGFVDSAPLASLYRDAAAYVALSLHEGFGLAVLDALHFGLPVVTHGRGALAEIATRESAYVVPEADPSLVAEALLRLLVDRALAERLTAAGRRAAARFGWARTAAETAAVYRDSLAYREPRGQA